MSSKKNLKKQINNMFFEVIEECFDQQMYNPSKKEVTEKLIDEVVDFRNDVMASINQAKTKKDFPAILSKIDQAEDDFITKLNQLQ